MKQWEFDLQLFRGMPPGAAKYFDEHPEAGCLFLLQFFGLLGVIGGGFLFYVAFANKPWGPIGLLPFIAFMIWVVTGLIKDERNARKARKQQSVENG